MQKTTRLQRLLAVVVAVFMAVCCLPLNAFAAGTRQVTVTYMYTDENGNYQYAQYADGSKSEEIQLEDWQTFLNWEYLREKLTIPEGYSFDESQKGNIDVSGNTLNVKVVKDIVPVKVVFSYAYEEDGEMKYAGTQEVSLNPGEYTVNELIDSATITIPENFKVVDGNAKVTITESTETYNINVVKESVPSTPIDPATVTVNVSYYDEANNEYVGNGETMTIKAGPYSLDYLVSEGYLHIPEGYKLVVYGNVNIASPTLVVNVEKESVPSTPIDPATVTVNVSYYDKANNEYVGKEQMTIKAGPYSLDYLVSEGYLHIPEGYKLVVYGNVNIASSTLVVNVEKESVPSTPIDPATLTVDVSYFDEAHNEYVGKEQMTIKAGPYSLDYLVSEGYLHIPEGYKLVVYGNVDIESPTLMVKVESIKTIRIIWSIDNDVASFANGNENTWTQELAWSHINDLIDMPEVSVPDGYVLKGWTIDGKALTGWDANVESFTVGRNYKEDENGGSIYITANIVKKDADDDDSSSDSSSNNTTATVTSTNSNNNNTQVVKAEAPADNTAKVMPQTGLTAETPVVFGVMMVAALAGAGAYLFAIRKKLN